MAHDDITIGFYTQEAEAYTARDQGAVSHHPDHFVSMLPEGGTVLELGCGSGRDSAFFISKGLKARPTDGTPEIAREAEKRLGIPVATLLFGDLDEDSTCDGIWANACLLHVPRPQLPDVISRIHRALKSGGVFYASFKASEAEGRDEFDRYFNYPSETWLRELYGAFPWKSIVITTGQGGGYDRKPTQWLHVMAVK